MEEGYAETTSRDPHLGGEAFGGSWVFVVWNFQVPNFKKVNLSIVFAI